MRKVDSLRTNFLSVSIVQRLLRLNNLNRSLRLSATACLINRGLPTLAAACLARLSQKTIQTLLIPRAMKFDHLQRAKNLNTLNTLTSQSAQCNSK
jgi:hypothetical protein